jgi:hypothetical protein
VISLQHGFGVTASQTPVAVLLTERPELLGGKVARTGVFCSPALAADVGFGLPDLLGVFLAPLFAAGDYFVSVQLVVLTFGSAYAFFVLCCPSLLVLGYLFFVFFLIPSACFDPMGKVCSGSLVLGVLLQAFPSILAHARTDTQLALVVVAVCILRVFIELREVFFDSASLADLQAHLTRCLGL